MRGSICGEESHTEIEQWQVKIKQHIDCQIKFVLKHFFAVTMECLQNVIDSHTLTHAYAQHACANKVANKSDEKWHAIVCCWLFYYNPSGSIDEFFRWLVFASAFRFPFICIPVYGLSHANTFFLQTWDIERKFHIPTARIHFLQPLDFNSTTSVLFVAWAREMRIE